MTTNNAVNSPLSGTTGTGNFVGSTSATLVTPTLGAATATSLAFSPTTGGIIGTTAADSATAGDVGEVISSNIPQGSAVSLTSNTNANVTSISLTAGDWDVYANIYSNPGSNTLTTSFFGQITTTSATFTFPPTITTPTSGGNNLTGSATEGFFLAVGPARINVSGTTTVYLVATSIFTVSTQAVYGYLISIRRR
jgi:hypothetical protein